MHNNTSMEMCLLILSHEDNFYRPQRSWAKVISSQASVCPGGVVCPEGGVICLGGGGLPGGCLVLGGVWSWGGGSGPRGMVYLGGSGPGEGGLVPGDVVYPGGVVPGGVCSWGVSNFSGGVRGSPIFRGGGLQFLGG